MSEVKLIYDQQYEEGKEKFTVYNDSDNVMFAGIGQSLYEAVGDFFVSNREIFKIKIVKGNG